MRYRQSQTRSPPNFHGQKNYRDSLESSGIIVAHFEKPIRPFRLFCTSSQTKKIIKSVRTYQCSKCWRFHDARTCYHYQRCIRYGTESHPICQSLPRCTNFKGPYSADEKLCPARPLVRSRIIRHLN